MEKIADAKIELAESYYNFFWWKKGTITSNWKMIVRLVDWRSVPLYFISPFPIFLKIIYYYLIYVHELPTVHSKEETQG